MGPQVPDEYLFKVVDAIAAVGEEVGKTVPQVALNWLLQPADRRLGHRVGARDEKQLAREPGLDRLEPERRAGRAPRRSERGAVARIRIGTRRVSRSRNPAPV